MHAQPTILLATKDFVVIDKPSGMLSVPGIGPEKQACAVSWVREHFPQATGPMMVHRLDMDTSGVLLVALTAPAQAALSSQFEARTTHKTYIALCEGDTLTDEGVIDLPLRLDIDRRPYQIVDFVQGKPARTFYRVQSREVDRTRVLMEPLTGRTHQLRVHAASPLFMTLPDSTRTTGGLATPIQGDMLYGNASTAPRLMLHARTLTFHDPASGQAVTCSAPTPF
jgi:tRNA pseudouridine32 synthase / 23S rRNA pseudouridine746 synthase